jgi:hypothetical protein
MELGPSKLGLTLPTEPRLARGTLSWPKSDKPDFGWGRGAERVRRANLLPPQRVENALIWVNLLRRRRD